LSDQIIVERNYEPTEKMNRFHASLANVIVLVGGYGSGKSRGVIEELIQTGLEHEGCPMAVYRKTMPALRDSTLHEYKKHVPSEIGEYRERPEEYLFHTNSFIRFRGLDEDTKQKSTNYATIVMEEAEEFSFEEFKTLHARVRAMGPWRLRIILVLNPVDDSHWIYKQFVENAEAWDSAGREVNGNRGPGLLVLHLSTRDNLKNLPAGYIAQVSAGLTADEISRYIDGQWGSIIKGDPVYAKILNPDIHLRTVEYVPGAFTLLRGWDFGFNHPACSFRLVDLYGRKNIDFEMLGEKESLDVFAKRVKQLTSQRYGQHIKVTDYGDPRGHDKSDKGATSFEILQEEGIFAIGERGVREYVEPGIKLVRKELSTLIQGVPELTINPNCTYIRAAYFGKYVRDEEGKPKKDGFYEHLCDADRYISYHHKSNDAVKDAILARQTKRSTRSANKYTGY
jgi:phage terminase large subunit